MKVGTKLLSVLLTAALMASMLAGCGYRTYRDMWDGVPQQGTAGGGTTDDSTANDGDEDAAPEEEERSFDEIAAEYLETIQPADDEHDFMFANDFEDHSLIKVYKLRDSSAYDAVLGEYTVTVEDI